MQFPSSPTLNQTYTYSNKTWKWNGKGWQIDTADSLSWANITGKPTEFTPSTHSHTISNVTGLQTALDGKAAASHSHAISDVTGLQTALDGKQASGSYVTTALTITAGNGLTGGGTLAANRTITLGTPGTITNATTNSVTSTSHTHALTVTKADVGLGNVDNTSDLNKPISTATQSALDGKAATTHWHDQTDITGLAGALSDKADVVHSHAISDVTGLQSALDGKQTTLVSGTNIKTVNGTSLLGTGDITVGSSIGITNDTSTDTSQYPAMARATSGNLAASYVSSTKLYFNPSTGTLNSTNFNSLSDRNFKTNIEPIHQDTVNKFSHINPVSFEWKDTGKSAFGVIAQEIEPLFPELVNTNEQGIKSVSYDQLVPILISIVQQQQREIDSIKAKLGERT